ncbi:5-(carboxyamino)imidazole ribonucleotide synthase [Palleronia sp.]|uniref:5-(carboxyamino)imidazole ribonucleotide synthase n=1 Tax=Palleronia sp. TaxID=1940284 RepID=UPI0035C799F6
MTEPLSPGSTIGILGGGQLGRMLAVAAGRLGLRVHVYDPSEAPPAAEVACHHTAADFTDEAALTAFAQGVDVVTYEFENIPTAALDILEAHRPIRPNREALRVSQDRLTEKTWLSELGLAVAPFADIPDAAALADALERIGTPAILKTRRFGYDGKGQARISASDEAEAALASLQAAPAILEGFVPFTKEISVIGARGLDGRVACFDPGENVHEDGILRRTAVPAGIPHAMATDAVLIASRILTALDYVGVLGVELFVTEAGLVVNEIAPRVHNSGHWTQNGCVIDQFEQHIRAVAGWPLGDGQRHSDTEMENLIGDDMDRVAQIAAEPGAALHLYGKSETRPGRKMGHVNRLR